MKKRLLQICFLFFAFVAAENSIAQTVTVDGNFTDWTNIQWAGQNGDGSLLGCKTFGDADKIYFYIEGNSNLDIGVSSGNKLTIYLNMDDNAGTGNNSGNYTESGIDMYYDGRLTTGKIYKFSGATPSTWLFDQVSGYGYAEIMNISNFVTLGNGNKAVELSFKKSMISQLISPLALNSYFSFAIIVEGTPSYLPIKKTASEASSFIKVPTIGGSLPVTLSSFTAVSSESFNELKWVTHAEINNSHFEVFRSDNGNVFEKIGTVSGNGNSDAINTYSFKDYNPNGNIIYYQLKQVDFDGKVTEFDIIDVKSKIKNSPLTISGIQSNEKLELGIYSDTSEASTLQLTDLAGNIIYNAKVNLAGGYHIITIPVSITRGVYVATLTTPGKRVSEKILYN